MIPAGRSRTVGIFHPLPDALAFSENLRGLAPITAPIIALTHAPLAAYNAAFLLSYVLSGLGAYVPASGFDVPMDYEALAASGAMLGHGGIVVFDDTVDMARMARFAMEFCSIESCGKCTPCRVGSTRGVETIDRIIAGQDVATNLVLLDDLCETMTKGSLCAMGGLTPMPVQSAIKHFPEDFERPNVEQGAPA